MLSAPTAVRLRPAFDDPASVRRVIDGGSPLWPLARYAASPAEREATGGEGRTTFVPPWFRRDFALGGQALVDGAELILHNPHFVDAAHRVYGAEAMVRPTTVYVNVMGPTPFPFVPHVDVPAFRGVTRADHPVWLLHQMMVSGLFEAWRIRIATAVSWFYDGPGGAFHYWPDGPDQPAVVEEPPFANVAVVADNERTYHGVAPLGRPEDGLVKGLSVDAELVKAAGGWDIVEGGRVLGHVPARSARITVSWKAEVFADADDARRADEHLDDLDLDRVVATFLADLRSRGVAVTAPTDPLRDDEWVGVLAATYREPTPRIG